jgi:membrane protein DedA with SNARE-associated domain
MITWLVSYMQATFTMMGPWGVLLLSFIQEIIPPIPSTLVMASAGFVFLENDALGLSTVWKLFLYIGLPISLGLTIGAMIIYGLVYWGGKPLVDRYGRYTGVSWEEIEKVRTYLRGHVWDDVLFFFARVFPLIPSIALNIFAGLVRWSAIRFAVYTFLGTIIRSMLMGFLGWEFAQVYNRYAVYLDTMQNTIFLLVVVAVGLYLYYRKKERVT